MADTTLMGDNSEAQQYLDTFRRAEYLEPEKALIAAILEDAIHVRCAIETEAASGH